MLISYIFLIRRYSILGVYFLRVILVALDYTSILGRGAGTIPHHVFYDRSQVA